MVILVTLGAPLVMHVVMHDLHADPHQTMDLSFASDHERGGHEHPLIASASTRMPAFVRIATTSAQIATDVSPSLARSMADLRNVIAPGAVDDDTGLQSLLSTLLV